MAGKIREALKRRGDQHEFVFSDEFGVSLLNAVEDWRAQMRGDERRLADIGPDAGPFDTSETVSKAAVASRGRRGAGFLFLLTVLWRPRCVVELGTNLGISSAYIASGIKASLSGGQIVTIDASPAKLEIAQEMHSSIGLDNVEYIAGKFVDELAGAVDALDDIDMIFIDAHYEPKAVRHYLDEMKRKVSNRCLYVQNGVEGSPAMAGFWNRLSDDPWVKFSGVFDGVGIALMKPTIV
ncbi:MAG: class I SAM-dependent methyltransferase [Microcystis panniformis Mp_MB_F_20080800_S26]|nr:MAG: class I SAM-dependent methyltransferase [Microcystis panniformis Mp_MB_F_20080800_S26]